MLGNAEIWTRYLLLEREPIDQAHTVDAAAAATTTVTADVAAVRAIAMILTNGPLSLLRRG